MHKNNDTVISFALFGEGHVPFVVSAPWSLEELGSQKSDELSLDSRGFSSTTEHVANFEQTLALSCALHAPQIILVYLEAASHGRKEGASSQGGHTGCRWNS